MRIAIEAQRIFRKQKHGMDIVALEVIRALQKIDHENEYFIFTAGGDDVCLQETENFHIITLHSKFYPLWEQVLLPIAVRKVKPDLLHCTSNTAPLFPGAPLILHLHDIIFLERSTQKSSSLYQRMGRIYRRLVVPRILGKCRKIITVSGYEKICILETTLIKSSLVDIIYNGYDPVFNSSWDSDSRDYILFLGNTDPKKNTPGTLKGYARYLEKSKKKLRLMVADFAPEEAKKILEEIGHPEVMEKIAFTGYISHAELPNVYGHAQAFLYTSLRESFGIPQLEAMACGTPVIASCTSAIPEVAGDGALYVNPILPEDIANALIRIEEDKEYRDYYVKYGYERVKEFSWEKTAKQCLELYESQR